MPTPDLLHAMALVIMARRESGRGAIRRHRDGRLYVDFGPSHRVWYFPVGGQTIGLTKELAERILRDIRKRLEHAPDLDAALFEYKPRLSRPNLVESRLERWLVAKRRETRAGDLAETYLSELERWAQPGGHFGWWYGKCIFDVSEGELEDWAGSRSAHRPEAGCSPRRPDPACWEAFMRSCHGSTAGASWQRCRGPTRGLGFQSTSRDC